MHVAVENFGVQNAAAGVDEREMAAVGNRNAQIQMHERIYRKRGIHAREQIFEAGASDRGSENLVAVFAVGFDECGEFFAARGGRSC